MLRECVHCGNKRCSKSLVICSICEHELQTTFGADWKSTEWGKEYMKLADHQRIADREFDMITIPLIEDDHGCIQKSRCIVNTSVIKGRSGIMGRPKVETPDTIIEQMVKRGHGARVIFKRVTGGGHKVSFSTIQRRIKELKTNIK